METQSQEVKEKAERVQYQAKSKELLTKVEEISMRCMAALLANPGAYQAATQKPDVVAKVSVAMAVALLGAVDDFNSGDF